MIPKSMGTQMKAKLSVSLQLFHFKIWNACNVAPKNCFQTLKSLKKCKCLNIQAPYLLVLVWSHVCGKVNRKC